MLRGRLAQVLVRVLLLAGAFLPACSGGRSAVDSARPDRAGAQVSPAPPLGEQSPALLAAWRRSDAEWAEWVDPSTRHVRFIALPGAAGKPVRLELIDWGGQGPALVLLAGLGENAHIYNDLAPGLTDRFRVI